MQQDRLRDFLKFFRFHLPWFVLSAGFFAVILLSGLYFSSKLTNFQNAQNQVAEQELGLSIPQEELPVELPKVRDPVSPEAPVAPSPVVKPTENPSPIVSPFATVTPKRVEVPIATSRPIPTQQPQANSETIIDEVAQGSRSYDVKRGDTLWDISIKMYGNGHDYSLISRENKLTNPGQLVSGQKLIIPAKAQSGKITSGVSIDHGDDDAAVSSDIYKIVKGDSLWKIAERRLGDPYRWTELYQLNKSVIGANPDLIYPEAVLKIPTRTAGTSSSSSLESSSNWTSSLLQ